MNAAEICREAVQKGMDCSVTININPVNEIHGVVAAIATVLIVLGFLGLMIAASR